ncbi:MAG: hypothetical protein F6K31_16030 [Symploca sp. SIO2G7]|nr:hypothetical protein [Symploca sp. SIO2G7]
MLRSNALDGELGSWGVGEMGSWGVGEAMPQALRWCPRRSHNLSPLLKT